MRQGLGPILGFVLAVLADEANEKNTCWPRISTLAGRVSTRTVQRAIRILAKRELIAVEQRNRTDGSCSSNLYRLRLERSEKLSVGGDRLSPPTRTSREQSISMTTTCYTINSPYT